MAYTAGPFDAPHLVLQWGGKLSGGAEEWSCSLRFARTTGLAGNGYSDTMLTACKNAIQTFHADGTVKISSQAKLSYVKLNPVDVNGHYTDANTHQIIVADVGGGYAGQIYPNQVALAVTLNTAFSRGPAHKGRFYIPIPCLSVATLQNGLISSTDATAVKTAATTMLNSLNNAAADMSVAVFSRKAGSPAHHNVTSISVGQVLDTQRRRRRKLLEAYV